MTQFVEKMEPAIELLVLQGKELVEDEERELGARDRRQAASKKTPSNGALFQGYL